MGLMSPNTCILIDQMSWEERIWEGEEGARGKGARRGGGEDRGSRRGRGKGRGKWGELRWCVWGGGGGVGWGGGGEGKHAG